MWSPILAPKANREETHGEFPFGMCFLTLCVGLPSASSATLRETNPVIRVDRWAGSWHRIALLLRRNLSP